MAKDKKLAKPKKLEKKVNLTILNGPKGESPDADHKDW
jgi:hypothetical protein